MSKSRIFPLKKLVTSGRFPLYHPLNFSYFLMRIWCFRFSYWVYFLLSSWCCGRLLQLRMNRERYSLARSCFVCNLADVQPPQPTRHPLFLSLLCGIDVRILSVRGLILFFCCSRERAGSAQIRELHCQVRMIYLTNISIHQQHRFGWCKEKRKRGT